MRNNRILFWEPVHLSGASQENSALSGYSLPGSDPQVYRTRNSFSMYPQRKNLRNTDPPQTNSKETDEEVQNSNC